MNVQNFIDQEVHYICDSTINQINATKLNYNSIRKETQNEAVLSKILYELRNSNVIDSDYTIDSDIFFKGQRAVVPASLQEGVLEELHHTHIGITKMKQLARRYVYWMSIDKDIEKFLRSCAACTFVKKSPPKVTLHPWEEPEHNWQRIHIDYAGPYQSHYFLVVIDAKSKWAEVGVSTSAPTSVSTMEMLQNIFSRNGFPEVMVSDNATIFKSDEFTKFCTDAGIFQKCIAPGHPATNGLAERNIQTLKQRLAAMSADFSPMPKKIRDILFKYRATPLINGKTPSEQYLGRQIRIRLDALKLSSLCKTFTALETVRELSEGDRVQARYYTSNTQSWKLGVIIKRVGRLHYFVKLDDGFIFKRHIDQLRSTEVTNADLQPQYIVPNGDKDYHLQLLQQQMDNPSNPVTPAVREESAQDGTQAEEISMPNQDPTRTVGRQRKPPMYLNDYIRD